MELLNLENLFNNVKIENDKRLSPEDQQQMDVFKNVLEDLQTTGKKYIEFYEENKLYNYDSYKKDIKEIEISILTLKDNFIENVLLPEIKKLINHVIYYFKNKYNVTLKENNHKTDYSTKHWSVSAKENFNYFMNMSIDDILDDIFNQLGNVSFENKALEEAKKNIIDSCKTWRDEKKVIVKNAKISIKDFIYYDSWALQWGDGYRNNDNEKIVNLFKLITYYNKNELNNNYEFITTPLNDYQNKYVGMYEINDSILKSFKTFKNGKIELNFTNGLKALDFAKKYLGYEE